MSRSPWSVEEILTICHVSRPLIGTIVGVVSRVQSALYTYLLSHNKTNNTCCYGTSQFVIRNNWQKIILTCFRSCAGCIQWLLYLPLPSLLTRWPMGPPFFTCNLNSIYTSVVWWSLAKGRVLGRFTCQSKEPSWYIYGNAYWLNCFGSVSGC